MSHTVGATQSLTDVHAARQVPFASHLYGVQSCVVPSAPVIVWSPSHVAPAFGVHWPPAPQPKPVAQCASVVQLVRHFVVPSHAKPPAQDLAAPDTHAPAPLHALKLSLPEAQFEPQPIVALG